MCYVALGLEVSRLEAGVFDGSLRFWNRRYADVMLHSARNMELSDLELSTPRVYFLCRLSSFVSTRPRDMIVSFTLFCSQSHVNFLEQIMIGQYQLRWYLMLPLSGQGGELRVIELHVFDEFFLVSETSGM